MEVQARADDLRGRQRWYATVDNRVNGKWSLLYSSDTRSESDRMADFKESH
jgi:hypothetical protein